MGRKDMPAGLAAQDVNFELPEDDAMSHGAAQ
jgi:hypothetical protein